MCCNRFREDVKGGKLAGRVSWLVAPEAFSDHPASAWYGAWYISETLDILTENPEVWKKTIFILCYDENDGYFDHVPPFLVAPHPQKPETGLASEGIDTALEQMSREQDLQKVPEKGSPGGPDRDWGYLRAAGRCFALEPGRLCQLAGVRSYFRVDVPGKIFGGPIWEEDRRNQYQ